MNYFQTCKQEHIRALTDYLVMLTEIHVLVKMQSYSLLLNCLLLAVKPSGYRYLSLLSTVQTVSVVHKLTRLPNQGAFILFF